MDTSLTLNIKNKSNLSTLIWRFPVFEELTNSTITEYEIEDNMCISHNLYKWEYQSKEIVLLQVMFIGKTGYGKSSLINAILGENIFQIDEVQSCTKELDTALYCMDQNERCFLALTDLPGMGESDSADIKYMEWYKNMLPTSCCVVYVIRADQRDFAIDEVIFDELFRHEKERDKVIVALNFADKIEPINRDGKISAAQRRALEDKTELVENIFDIWPVIPCCAKTGEGVPELVAEIVDHLEGFVYPND